MANADNESAAARTFMYSVSMDERNVLADEIRRPSTNAASVTINPAASLNDVGGVAAEVMLRQAVPYQNAGFRTDE